VHLWELLEVRSVALLAPRRLGKTSVCRRLTAYPPDWAAVSMCDLEGTRSVLGFLHQLHRDVVALLGEVAPVRAESWLTAMTGQASAERLPARVPEPDWRRWLEALFDDVTTWSDVHDTHAIFIWDEFPLFLQDLHRTSEDRTAMVLLDTLRALRARHPRVRMVYTGSVGLHEVLHELAVDGYANDPVNDMAKVPVDVLEGEDAVELARALLRGIAIHPNAPPNKLIVEALLAETEGHPLLLQRVAESLRHQRHITPSVVRRVFDELLDNAHDPFELSHYVERLGVYLGAGAQRTAERVLDALSLSDGCTLGELHARLAGDLDALRTVTRQLRRDGYIERAEGIFRFKRRYLQRYWAQERGL
jgi:hypothetical protein